MSYFKKMRGVKLPYARQGLIRFTCLNYSELAASDRERIDGLCESVGGPYADALFDVMCSPRSIRAIALDRHVSESTLYRLRARFYMDWDGS